MKPSDFLELVHRFSEKPIPATIYRHTYIWIGEEDDLLSKSPPGFIKTLNLHTLCNGLSKTPFGEKAAGRQLSEAVEDWLSKEFPPSHNQRCLMVTGLDLFYRYSLPMGIFIRLANENCMVVFYLSPLDVDFSPIKPLPSFISFSPRAICKYVTTEIPEEAIVKEE